MNRMILPMCILISFVAAQQPIEEKPKENNLLEVKVNGKIRQLIAFTMEERGIPRQGYEIYLDSKKVGVVTSGTQSPILKTGIGLGYSNCPFHKSSQQILISIRNKLIPAKIIKPPFINETSLHH